MLNRKIKRLLSLTLALSVIFTGCGAENGNGSTDNSANSSVVDSADNSTISADNSVDDDADNGTVELEDGEYTASFNTDSSMFHANEACEGKGTLKVKDGSMTLHVSLVSKKIVNLYSGTAAEAEQDKEGWLEPSTDTVTYSDGFTEEVYGFDIPVPGIDTEFDLAILGTKGKWYDHKVSVSEPEKKTEKTSLDDLKLDDGTYQVEVTLKGGSGKAGIKSPTELKVEDGRATVSIVWSSQNYDYMLMDDEKYEVVTLDGGSTFVLPVSEFDWDMPVVADTTAMSKPHEIEYTINLNSSSIKEK